jgi:hypothetical protein
MPGDPQTSKEISEMILKYFVDRYTVDRGWIRITEDLKSLDIAENMKATLAQRSGSPIDNYSIVIQGE